MSNPTSGILGVDVTQAHAVAPDHPVGTITRAQDGQEYMLVLANGAVVAGDVCLLAAANTYDATPITLALSGAAFGRKCVVSQVVAADNEFFWGLVNGRGNVLVLASAAANAQLNTTATGGSLDDDATAGSEDITGIALEAADSGSGGVVSAHITYPTVGATNV